VTVSGRKTLGMAQRRTRHGALFQCAVPLRWEPERLLTLLALDDADAEQALYELTAAVGHVPGRSRAQVVEAFTGLLLGAA
jgi:lipoate-protein ligase A